MSYARICSITILIFCGAISAEASTATWDRNPESTVVGYVLSYGTQSGVHSTSVDAGNVVTYQFFPPPGQRYYVVVQAYDASGALSPKSTEVIYDAPSAPPQNQAPTLSQPANQTSTQNTAASYQLTATDPEGAALNYSVSGLPAGLAINSGSGRISGTPTATGTFTVTATVSDGSLTASRTFTWTVTAAASGTTTVNLSPVDTTLNINSTNYVSDPRLSLYTYPANRVANAILMKFDLSQIPANATIQSASLQLTLVAIDGATNDANYSVSLHQVINRNPDLTRATGSSADGVNAWTASSCCYQNIPLAQADISPARTVLAVDRTMGAKTWDALSIVQAWRTTPSTNYGLLLNSDATKPADRYRYFASMEDTTVSARPVMRVTYSVAGGGTGGGDTTAPTVSMTAPSNNATVAGSSVTVSATASDATGVVGVQFRLDGANLGSEDTSSPYSIVWNASSASNGSHVLTAVARDAAGNIGTSTSIIVTVNNVTANRAPVLTQPANQTSAEGSAVSLALTATDPDGNALTYTATGLPPGLAVNASSGVIAGTPNYTSAATYSVTATASDGSLSSSRTFSWVVSNTNRPPTVTKPADQSGDSGTAVNLQVTASDPDGTAVTYQATNLPAGLAINASTGRITGTPSAGSPGSYDVVITASDGQLTGTATFKWAIDGTDVGIRGDFDGDGRNDPASYRPSTGEWRIWRSSNNFAMSTPIVWGVASDLPVAADYDGDRKTDIAVYRPSAGTWVVLLSSTNYQSNLTLQWGNAGDRPMPIDYDNDGRADLALPRFGGFEILLSGSNYTTSVTVR